VVARNAKRLWCGLAESEFGGSLESGSQFCVVAFGGDLASITVKMCHI
jgi:hypothetical protein